jgi:hypothetical protein
VHSAAGITSRETLPGVVLLGGLVDQAQKMSLRGRLKTLPAVRFRQVLGYDFGVATFYNDSALFGLSYLTTLVLSHLSPHAIEVAQIFDHVCHPGDLPEALPVKWQEVDDCRVKTLQENPFPGEVASEDCKNLQLPGYLMHRFAFYRFDHYAPRLGQTRHRAKLDAQSLLEKQGNARDKSATVEISQNADIRGSHLQPPRTTEQRALRRSFYELVPLPVFLCGQIA